MNLGAADLVFLAGFVVYTGIRHHWERRIGKPPTQQRHCDGLEIVLLALVFVGCLLLPVVYLATPWLDFAAWPRPTVVGAVGVAVLGLALWLFWRSHRDLDTNWSPTLALRQDHRLVTDGVYRRIRHPMYAAILLFSLAQGLLLANWLAGWSALATFALLCVIRVPREERMLERQFGDAWVRYRNRTGRLLPRWRSPTG